MSPHEHESRQEQEKCGHLVQLLPNTVKKTLLEGKALDFSCMMGRGEEGGEAEEEPCGPFL